MLLFSFRLSLTNVNTAYLLLVSARQIRGTKYHAGRSLFFKVAADELKIRVGSWAVNPADAIVHDTALPLIIYASILGEDALGAVEGVERAAFSGSKAEGRTLVLILDAPVAKLKQGGFQKDMFFGLCNDLQGSRLSVLRSRFDFPPCIAAAAHGLLPKDYLALRCLKANSSNTGKSILSQRGSSGVDSNAIQL